MTTVKEFTPVLMYVDHDKIDLIMNEAKENEERINKGLDQLETFLGKAMSDQERTDLLNNGDSGLHQKIKEQFPFPNATDQINLEMLGKAQDYQQNRIVASQINAAFQSYKFTIREGKVVLTDEGKETIILKNTHSTQNDAQSGAFKLAEKIVKNLNTAREKGWINQYDVHQVKTGIKIINEIRGKFLPHYGNISKIREDGGFSEH